MHKKNYLKQPVANTSLYEAVGKMVLGNSTTGRNMNPAALNFIGKAIAAEQDEAYEELLEKPLWQFTGKDHENMLKHVLMESLSGEGNDHLSNKNYVQ